MKVLFALNQNSEKTTEESILGYFKEVTGTSFEFVKEYDLLGVTKRLKLEKFDLLVLNEELEKDSFVTTSFLDDITDKFSNFRVILIVNSEHEQDNYIKRLFNIGTYDLIYSSDISIENIVNLMIKGRTKAEAKLYLDLHDVDDVSVEKELNYIPEAELERIINYFSSLDDDVVSQVFDHICSQYNDQQIVFLIDKLPRSTTDILLKEKNANYLKGLEKLKQINFEDVSLNIETNESNKPSKKNDNQKPKPNKDPLFSFNFPTRQVVENRIIGTLLIGIGGTSNSAGTTHTVIGMAAFLQKLKQKVAIIEFNDNPKLKNLLMQAESVKDNYFTFKGVDVYYQKTNKHDLDNFNMLFINIKSKDYKYIIFDLGTLKRINERGVMAPTLSYKEMWRTDYQFLCIDGSYWGWNNINFYRSDSLADIEPDINNWISIVNLATNNRFKTIEKETRNITVMKKIVQAPIFLEPFNIDDEAYSYFASLTNSFIPSSLLEKKKSGFLKFTK